MKDYFHVCVGKFHIDIVPAYTEDEAINIVYVKWNDMFPKRAEWRAIRCNKT